MPLKHKPKTLRESSMASIARNFDLICYNCKSPKEMGRMIEDDSYRKVKGPFVHMPPSLCNGLQDAIQSENGGLRQRHLFLLLHRYQDEFRISITPDKAYALLLLKERCLRLQRLDLSYLTHMNPESLVKLMPNLNHLVYLNLSMTEIMDQYLELIGKHCKELRDLNVSHCPVTNQGLIRLCYDEKENRSQCTKLIRLGIAETMITKTAVSFLLLRIPTLQDLDFDNTFQVFNLMSSPGSMKMSEVNSKLVFNLLKLTSTNDCISDISAELAIDLCPMATQVMINNSFIENEVLYKIMTLDMLTHLHITNNDNLTLDFQEGILPVLTICGDKLISLLLAKFPIVDVQAIGDCCPKLQNLALSEIGFFYEVMYFKENIFREIKALEIWTNISVETMCTPILRQLLSNCSKIHNLLVIGGKYLSDDLLTEIWKVNEMKELSRLTLENCPQISSVTLNHLFDTRNELTLIRIWSCFLITREDNNYFQKRIKKENCDVYFEWFPWQG